MKKVYLYLIIVLQVLSFGNSALAQCTWSGWAGIGTQDPPADGSWITVGQGSGAYHHFYMYAGSRYQFQTCGGATNPGYIGSSTDPSGDTQLSLYQYDGSTWVLTASNDDGCVNYNGNNWLSFIDFTPTWNSANPAGDNIIVTNRFNCQQHDFTGVSAYLQYREVVQAGTITPDATTISCGGSVNFTITGNVGINRTWIGAVPSVGSTSLIAGWNTCSDCYDNQTSFSQQFNSPGVYLVRTHARGAGSGKWNYNSYSDTWITVNSLPAPQAIGNVTVGPVPTFCGTALLADGNVTASSNCCGNHEAYKGRLFNVGCAASGVTCWATANNVVGEYWQVDLGSVKPVNGVATQGRGDCCGQYVSSYQVLLSLDGSTYFTVPGTFSANSDQNTVVTNWFGQYHARYVRIYPQTWVNHMSMRADVLSIPEGSTGAAQTVYASGELTGSANTVRWYNASSGGSLLATGQYASFSITANTTVYAAAYNSSTGCESSTRTAVVLRVNDIYGAGPGGVGNTNGKSLLNTWLNASTINQTVGSAVSTITDQSGRGFNATQGTGANQPTLQLSAGMNNQPVIRGDGSNDYVATSNTLYNYSGSFYGSNVTPWTVVSASKYNGSNQRVISAVSNNWLLGHHGNLEDRFYFEGWFTGGSCSPGGSGPANVAKIYTGDGNRYWGRAYGNGTNLASALCGIQAPGGISLLAYGGGSEPSNADVGEVAAYELVLNDARRNIVENYMAAKYNVTIANDKYAGDGVGDCDFDVIGVGRESSGVHLTGIASGLTITTTVADFLKDNGDYFVAGRNSGTLGWEISDLTTCGSPNPSRRLSRVWYFDKTDVGTAGGNLTFTFNPGAALIAGTYHLMYRSGSTGTFSSVANTSTVAGNTVSFTLNASSLNDGQYTLAYAADIPRALSFTGSQYAVHATTGMSPTSGTVMGWVRPTQTADWGFWQTHDLNGANFADWISMFSYVDGTFYFRISSASACCNNDLTFATASYVPANQWTHLAFTWSSTTMTIYVNGNQIATRTFTPNAAINGSARIGQGHDRMMKGLLDEIAIYNTPLTAAQIQARMHTRYDNTDALWNNMVADFKMDEASGTLWDHSQNANNATPVGSPTPTALHPATPSISGVTAACVNTAGTTFTISNANANSRLTNYTWSVTGGTINSGQGTSSISVTFTSTGTQTVNVTVTHSNECQTETATKSVSIDAASSYGTLSTTGPVVTCDQVGNITAPTVSGAVGTVWWDWGRSDGSVGGSNWVSGNTSGSCCFPVNPGISGPGADRVRVKSTNGTCPTVTSAWIQIENRNSPAPSSMTASSTTYCSTAVPGSITLTANFPSGGSVFTDVLSTYSTVQFFSGSCGGTLLGTGTVTGSPPSAATFTLTGGNIPSTPGTYTFYARSTSSCETSTCATVTITVNSVAAVTSVTAAANPICGQGTTAITANGVSGTGASLVWYTGAGATGSNLGSSNPLTVGAGTYYARVTGTCGTAEQSITVNLETTSPTVTVPSGVTVYSSPNNACKGAAVFGVATANDACATGASGSINVLPSSGLVLWTRADAGVVKDGSGNVAQWSDLSGSGNHFTQATFANRPTLQASSINGYPAIRFNTSQFLTNITNFSSANYTVITISKENGGTNSRLISSANVNWLLGYWGNNRGVMYANGWVYGSTGSTPDQAAHMYSATGTGALTTFYDFGSVIASNANGVAAPGQLQLNGWNGAVSETSDGDVAEVIVYNRVLTTAERQLIEGYLAYKYNVAAPLAAQQSFQTYTAGNTNATFNAADAAGNVSAAATQAVTINTYPGPSVAASATSTCVSNPITLSVTGMAPAGQSANCVATSDYLNVTSVPIGSNWTIMGWVKFPLPSTGGAGNWNTLVRGTANHHIICNNDGTNKYLGTYVSGFQSSGFSVNQLSAGWHHIAAVGSGGGTGFYVDGVFVGRTTAQPTDNLVAIGNYQGGGQQFGQFDEISIWNTTVSQNDISNWMTRGVTSSHPNWANLVAYYKLDNNGTDSKAGTYPAVIGGAATWSTASAFYNYTWSGPGGSYSNNNNTAESTVVTNPATGTYTVYASANSCNSQTSNSPAISVDPLTVGGSVGGSTTICLGSGTGTLNLTGQTGAVQFWEKSSNAGSSWTNIANTSAAYSETPSSSGTWLYRAVVKSGLCNTVASVAATIVVDPAVAGGSISGGTTPLCLGSATGNMSLSGYATTIVRWEKQLGSGSWSTISNTTATYSETPSAAGTWNYRALVQSGTCGNAYSGTRTIQVDANTVAGNVTGSSTICLGAGTGTLTLNSYAGSILNWEKSNNAGGSWSNISNTNNTYSETPVSSGTWLYRAVVKSGVCATLASVEATVVVNPASSGGTLGGASTPICLGAGTGTMTVSGYTGTVNKWQKRVNSGSWSDIANNTNQYSEIPSSAGTWEYRVEVQSGVCGAVYSSVQAVTVVQAPQTSPTTVIVTPGSACGTSLPATIQLIATGGNPGTGGVANWYEGGCGTTFVANGSSPTIVTPSTTTTYYVRYENICGSTVCGQVTFNVTQPLTSVSITPSANPICQGTNLGLSATNYAGATYSWGGPGGYTASGQSITRSNVQESTGEGTYTVSATNICNTTVMASVAINVHAPIPGVINVVYYSPYPGSPISGLCQGSDLQIRAEASTAYPNDITWSWSGPNGYTSGVQNPLITNVQPSQHSGAYDVNASNACSSIDGYGSSVTVDAHIDANPDAIGAANSGVNDLDPITIEACGAYSLTLTGNNPSPGSGNWTLGSTTPSMTAAVTGWGGPTTNATVTPTVNEHGAYTFTWTVTNGTCSDDSSIRVFFTPAISVVTELAGCSFVSPDNDIIKVTASGGWNPGSQPAVNYLTATPPAGDNLLVDVSTNSQLIQVFTAPFDGLSHTYKVDDQICVYTPSVTTKTDHPTDIPFPTVSGIDSTKCIDKSFNQWLTFRDDNNNAILSLDDNNQDLGEVTVKVFKDAMIPSIAGTPGSTCSGYLNTAMQRHFVITAGNTFQNPVDVRLYFSDDELNNLIAESANNDIASDNCSYNDNVGSINDLYVTKYTGTDEDGDYTNNAPGGLYKVYGNPTALPTQPDGPLNKSANGFSTVYSGGNPHHYVQLSVNEFSELWLHGSGSGTALPVEMLYIEANAINNTYIQVKWATALEINNNGFQVERSTDGSNWTAIGWVDGHNNTTTQQNYSYDDYSVQPNVRYYYRLKQIDNDGQYEYTGMVSAIINLAITFDVKDFIPNPATNTTALIITATNSQGIEVDIYNGIGQKVITQQHTLNKGTNQISFDIANLAAGTYTAVVSSANEVYSKKLVVVK